MAPEPLALHGGPSVRGGRPWPRWPRHDGATAAALLEALDEGRWTVSWPGAGRPALERRFAEAFAEFHDVPHALAVDHGSTALTVALELLDIGPGDEVIVPAVTWVATASAVLRVGALPVLADVDPSTGCVDPAAIGPLLSPRVKAVICVHLACTVADLARLLEVARSAGVALIEDAAQAHGAVWNGRRVGSWGDVGAFSFQSGKVLAAGEGGAVLVHDEGTWRRAQQLRADARAYTRPVRGAMELVEVGEVIGANRTMSEFHAAILLDRLPHLDAEHDERELNARRFEAAVAALDLGIGLVPVPESTTRRSIYEYAIRWDRTRFGGADPALVAAALSAELERPVYLPDAPLFDNVLFRPGTLRRYAAAWNDGGQARAFGRPFDGAMRYWASTLLVHHSALLGDGDGVDDLVAALVKVREAAVAGVLAPGR
jgi:L-glutamine:2-deoxy-scyllo-inosose/3-amino-2,3-dideoxy-scyllo-inosose aminotransferase